MLLAAVAVKALLAWAGEVLPRRSALRMVDQLRDALLDRVVAQDRSWTARQRPAALVQLATTGVAGLENYAARYLPQLVITALRAGWAWWCSSPSRTCCPPSSSAVTLPLVPLFMALVGLRTRDEANRSYRALQLLGGHFLDLIRGLPTLKVFGRSRSQEEGIRRAGDDYRIATNTTLRIAFMSSMVLELLATISVALVAVSIGLRLIGGSMDLRTGLTVLLVAPEAFLALRAVGTHFHASVDGLTAADRLFTVLDAPVPAPGTRPAPAGDLRVTATLHAVTLDVTATVGTVTLLTGASGAGKSTALSLLAALARPDGGTVTVDGVDLTQVAPDAWQAHVGYLVQSPYLPAGSVRDVASGNASGRHRCVTSPPRCTRPSRTRWSPVCRPASTPCWRRAARSSPRASEPGWRWPAPCCPTGRCCCSTNRPRRWTRPPRPNSSGGCRAQLAGRTVVIASHRPALRALADEVVHVSDHDAMLVGPAEGAG